LRKVEYATSSAGDSLHEELEERGVQAVKDSIARSAYIAIFQAYSHPPWYAAHPWEACSFLTPALKCFLAAEK
jgi:hypothetical protein